MVVFIVFLLFSYCVCLIMCSYCFSYWLFFSVVVYKMIIISEVGGVNSPANPNREVVFRVCVCVASVRAWRDAMQDQGLSRYVNVLLLLLLRLLLLLLLADRCNGNEKSSASSIKVIFQVVIYKKWFFSLEKLMFSFSCFSVQVVFYKKRTFFYGTN